MPHSSPLIDSVAATDEPTIAQDLRSLLVLGTQSGGPAYSYPVCVDV
jgi:hypothetical protein